MDKRRQTNKGLEREKPEKKEKVIKYISTEDKKVSDWSVLKRKDGIILAFLEIIPFILGYKH